jgi:2-polyprenyl-3-methyl-5-hydroxy-6-metoxy-1,4-benzoquinol methylase
MSTTHGSRKPKSRCSRFLALSGWEERRSSISAPLAARRLGARVHSFDFDRASVASTQLLRDKYYSNDADWTVEAGSALDRDYLGRLGTFDIVYSWGVLHHTGAMYAAIDGAATCVAPGGLFAFALYRKTRLCPAWTAEKRWPKAQPAPCISGYCGWRSW